MEEVKHYPVMYREVLDLLEIKNKKLVVDCTVGTGAHAYKMLEVMDKDGALIGIDKDEESLAVAKQRLIPFEGRFTLIKSDFFDLDTALENLNVTEVDAFLFDLGISTYQLSNPERGFSFLKDGPLDMRMNRDTFMSAQDLVTNLSEFELSSIFKKFGEERYSKRLARSIITARGKGPISTTAQLSEIIFNAVPYKARHQRIHPATRAFQALRIAVNKELDVLESAIRKAASFLKQDGRIGVISFHSLEDRIAKHTIRSLYSDGVLKIITKKPLLPSDEEISKNKASRSAKMRVAVKVA
ncbi:MAG: 16S rRNA (cytosine(1402)-N(4))-methyltransferase RsmH [Candidatus Omnitrophica bacterium]|nr:16S rRNA (cytosine(1402)-N(4))-methyltransferase RsmH [Candidatus Omnitrophota bacterium]